MLSGRTRSGMPARVSTEVRRSEPRRGAPSLLSGQNHVHVPVDWSVFGLFDDDTTFRVGGALDSAQRYFAWTASFGVWR